MSHRTPAPNGWCSGNLRRHRHELRRVLQRSRFTPIKYLALWAAFSKIEDRRARIAHQRLSPLFYPLSSVSLRQRHGDVVEAGVYVDYLAGDSAGPIAA